MCCLGQLKTLTPQLQPAGVLPGVDVEPDPGCRCMNGDFAARRPVPSGGAHGLAADLRPIVLRGVEKPKSRLGTGSDRTGPRCCPRPFQTVAVAARIARTPESFPLDQ